MDFIKDLTGFELGNLIQNHLNPGERVLWIGKPNPKRHLWKTIPIMLFGLFWTIFALFWIAGAAGFKIPNFNRINFETLFPLFGIPFVLIGICMLISPLWLYIKVIHTIYAVTDKRCLTFSGVWTKSIRSFSSEDIENMIIIKNTNGSGDIVFASQKMIGNTNGFFGIQDVQSVEKIIKSVFEKII